MADLLVRGLSEQVRSTLRRRAERRGLSLQRYLVAELNQLAARPDMEEVLDRIDLKREGGSVGFERAVEDLRQSRDRR